MKILPRKRSVQNTSWLRRLEITSFIWGTPTDSKFILTSNWKLFDNYLLRYPFFELHSLWGCSRNIGTVDFIDQDFIDQGWTFSIQDNRYNILYQSVTNFYFELDIPALDKLHHKIRGFQNEIGLHLWSKSNLPFDNVFRSISSKNLMKKL